MSTRRPGASSLQTLETRPLPPKPSLDYERKQAKALLRQLRAGDAEATARALARHDRIRRVAAADITLADAQLVIAREYGFASWPRLVQYFREVERQTMARHSRSVPQREFHEQAARGIIRQHAARQRHVGRALTASVPRFYGLTIDEVFAETVSEEEARLTVARQQGCASWEALMEASAASQAVRGDPWRTASATLQLAQGAINVGDLGTLQGVVNDHPELLRPSAQDRQEFATVIHRSIGAEERRITGARAITDWLATQGCDVQVALNELLMDFRPRSPASVRFLLERGADPNWVAPNGVSVLEFALLRFWNDEAVDIIARHVVAKPALWIAAGLGRVDDVARFLDPNGQPTAAAYRDRPDFSAVGFPILPASAPDASEILAEAFFVAIVNDRTSVLEYFIDRGFPVDYLGWEQPFINFAIGNRFVRVVECLVRKGANLDLRGRYPDQSTRELARSMFEDMPNDDKLRRILQLCGAGTPESVIAERDARPAPEPALAGAVEQALELAADDAARRGELEVQIENLVIGAMRSGMDVFRAGSIDVDRLRAIIGDRVLPVDDRVERAKLPLAPAARDAIHSAIERIRSRRQDVVASTDLVLALIDVDSGFLTDLLGRSGSNIEELREVIDTLCSNR
jgi:hypothetical protein